MVNPPKPSGVSWDLSSLYSGMSDPKIEKDKKEISLLTKNFIQKYKSKINSPKLTVNFLVKALKDLEIIYNKAAKIDLYGYLLKVEKTDDEKKGQFFQATQEFYVQIYASLQWFDLEWIALDDKLVSKIINNPKLSKYQHYLKHERVFKPFRLTEKEEQIMTLKSQAGERAFVRFYEMLESPIIYQLKINGQTKKLTYGELTSLFSSPDRQLRQQVAKSYTQGLKTREKEIIYILNSILLDRKINRDIRKYQYPQQASFLGYETDKTIIDNMSQTIVKRYQLCERFYLLKQKLLNSTALHEWDRYSPIFNIKEQNYTWDEALDITLKTFASLSPQFVTIAKNLIKTKHIDSEVRPGKQSGGSSITATPTINPFINVNFTGKIKDITTIAHELGHAIHNTLSQKNSVMESHPSIPIAEIASKFCENLVFEKIIQQTKNKKLKINLLAHDLQYTFSGIFRQNVFYLFELDINLARQDHELTAQEIGDLWQKRLQAMFGKGLILTEDHRNWYLPISHFFVSNFYVYAYCFGELLTYSLLSKYQKEGQKFIPKYIQALSAGGSKTPIEITKMMGVDITDPHFWDQGLDLLEAQINEFEKITIS